MLGIRNVIAELVRIVEKYTIWWSIIESHSKIWKASIKGVGVFVQE